MSGVASFNATATLRDATTADHGAILALNLAAERVLSPMDAMHLLELDAQSACHRVVVADGRIVAFLLALREGARYDSPNYRWFADRYDAFLYIDRVVVADACHGRGVGRRLYEDLFAFAHGAGIDTITCEFDIQPPNEASRGFHARLGFREVGTQWLPGDRKQVSLQVMSLPVG